MNLRGLVRAVEVHRLDINPVEQEPIMLQEAVDGSDEDFGLGTQLAAEMLTGLVDNVHSTSESHPMTAGPGEATTQHGIIRLTMDRIFSFSDTLSSQHPVKTGQRLSSDSCSCSYSCPSFWTGLKL